MSKQLIMLKKMIDFIVLKEECDILKAFEKLIDFIAIKIHVDTAVVFSSKKDIFKDLDKIFDLELLKDNEWDHLGELLSILKPDEIELEKKEMDYCKLDIKENQFPLIILDPKVISGRKIIELYKKYGNSIVAYGICNSLLLYHISLVNFKLYNVNSVILYNPKKEINENDYNTSNSNWIYANRWNPVNVMLLH